MAVLSRRRELWLDGAGGRASERGGDRGPAVGIVRVVVRLESEFGVGVPGEAHRGRERRAGAVEAGDVGVPHRVEVGVLASGVLVLDVGGFEVLLQPRPAGVMRRPPERLAGLLGREPGAKVVGEVSRHWLEDRLAVLGERWRHSDAGAGGVVEFEGLGLQAHGLGESEAGAEEQSVEHRSVGAADADELWTGFRGREQTLDLVGGQLAAGSLRVIVLRGP
ncbi:MAG: hypothetical protein AAFP26_13465 [Planctomycetota bacterium]